MEDYDFSSSKAGASETIPMIAGQIKKGGLIMIKDQPCKVVDITTSKQKHGHAKCTFIAHNIFNNKKLEDILPSTHGTTVPIVTRTDYSLIDISDDNFLTLMDDYGETRVDLKLPDYPEHYADELKKTFKEKQLIVTVIKACGKEQIMTHKEDTN